MPQCEDCRAQHDGRDGWVIVELRRGGETILLTYCPACAKQFAPVEGWLLQPSHATATVLERATPSRNPLVQGMYAATDAPDPLMRQPAPGSSGPA